jgi:glycosyltransferase involved in cell wall biosynthesis
MEETPAIQKSLVVPIYKNEDNLPDLLSALKNLSRNQGPGFEVVLVVDGSPDASLDRLHAELPSLPFPTQLIAHSRNFGSFLAIRTGMEHARGEHIAVMAADLQEPPELVEKFFEMLESNAADVVFGQREKRDDPFLQKLWANCFWKLYGQLLPGIPKGGVDIFACNRKVKEAVLAIEEPNSSLIAQLFWVGYRRSFIPYQRMERKHGKSSWGFKRRVRYMLDSIFSYSDYPILFVLWLGLFGLVGSFLMGMVTLVAKLYGLIEVAGYTTLLLVGLFFGSALLTTQGIIGCYLWRTLENSKKRPLSLVVNVLKNKFYG